MRHKEVGAKKVGHATSRKHGKAKKLVVAAVMGLTALVASPEHIFKNGAPLPLAFTMR